MSTIPIIYRNTNLEILTKLLNSVAKKYGCAVEYIASDNRIRFSGDSNCCRQVTEETLSFFPKTVNQIEFPISCPIDGRPYENHRPTLS